MMAKEKNIMPIIIPTEKEKLLNGKVALITGVAVELDLPLLNHS